MSKFLKVTASIVTLVFTIALVAILYLFNLDPNEHKDWITGKFEENTGLALSLDGEIGLTLYPWLGITVDDVIIHNAPGFSDTPLLQAQRAEFRAKLLPLLNREYEIDTIHLAGASIHLETNAAGRSNWATTAVEPAQTQDVSASDPILNNLVLGGVDIQDAALTYDDRFNDVRYELTNITVSTGELVYGDPVDLFMGFNARASRPALSAAINFTGTVVYDLDNERYDLAPLNLTGTLSGANVPNGSAEISLTTSASMDFAQDTLSLRDFSLNALNAQVNANINGIDVTGDNPLYQVNLAAAGTDLAVLFRILENDELVAQISGLDSRAFSINGLVESRPNSGILNISGLDASLLDASITGNINASNLQNNPIVSGTIQAEGPDLPTLLEVAGQLQGGRDSTLASYGRELQQSPDQDFLLATRFDANLDTGNIDVPELEARLLGASVNGNINASRVNSDTPVIRGRLNASGPDLPLMLQIAGQLSGGRDSALNQYGRQLRNVNNKSFTINAPFDMDMGTGNIDLRGLEANLLGFRLNSSLQASNFQDDNGSMRGDITLSGRNLSQVLAALDQPDLAEVVQSINLSVSVNGTRNNLSLSPLDLNVVLSGPRIPNSPVTLALNADSVLDLDEDTLRTENFRLAGLGLDLQGSVNADTLSANPTFNGNLNVPAFNLRRFMQQLNQELPTTMDGGVFQTLAVRTTFSGSENDLRLGNLDMTLDDSRFTGNFNVAGFDNPAVEFDLDVTTLNLDRYLSPETGSAATSDVGNTELPVDTLRALNLKGKLNVSQLTYSNLKLANLALEFNASDGLLALAPISASLYEGTYAGDIRLWVNDTVPRASVDTTLNGINLAPLLRDFMDASYISGTGNIQLSLTGSGLDTVAIKRNLNGSGSLALQDGVLEGVDVGNVLQQVETMIRDQRARTLVRGERTPFDNFAATININNGIVSSNDLLIESSGFDVSGRGTLVNLTNDTLAFNLVANVDETPATDEQAYDIGGYSLPIACTGTLNNPTCLPDIQTILAGALRTAVQRGLTDLLQRAIGEPTDDTQGQAANGTTSDTPPAEEAAPATPRENFRRALEDLLKN